jgi:predicted esterase
MRTEHLRVSRTARLCLLGERSAAVDDVWIVCHGFAQLAADFIRPFTSIAADNRLIVAPEALSRFYLDTKPQQRGADAPVGATWMTREDRENEIRDYVDYLTAVHDWVFNVVPRTKARLTVLGFSQGVATVTRWLTGSRCEADRIVLWAGGIAEDAGELALRQALEGREVFVVHGENDPLTSADRVSQLTASLSTCGARLEVISFAGGHALNRATLESLAAR